MDCWDEVHKGIDRSTSEIQGRFKFGCHPSVGAYALPKFFDRLQKQAPKIEIDLVHDISRKITESIVSYQIDIGVVVNPTRHPDLVLKKLGDDRVLFWKRRGAEDIPKKLLADVNLYQIRDLLGKTHSKEFRGWQLVSTFQS